MAPVVVVQMTNPVVFQGGPVTGGPPVAAVSMVGAAAVGLDAVGWASAGVAPRGVRGMVACCASQFVVCLPMK